MSQVKNEKLKKIWEIFSGVYRYNVESKFRTLRPRSLMVNLTYRCNSRCVMCNIWQMRPKKEMLLSDWKKIMADPALSDIRNLTVSGGEPALYPDFTKAVKLFMDYLPNLRRIVINTNGFMPEVFLKKIEEIARTAKRKGIKLSVSVSIDGVGKTHDEIRRIRGGFEKCVRTVEGLKKLAGKYGFGVGVSSVLMRRNVGEFDKMLNWFAQTSTEGNFQIVGFHETFLNNKDSEKTLSIDSRAKDNFLAALEKIKASKKPWSLMRYYWEDMINMYGNNGVRTTPCTFLKDDLVVDSLGDVYYCLSVRPIGNVLKNGKGVGELYNDSKNLRFRRNLARTACLKCNSGCNNIQALAFDMKRYLYFLLTGKLWRVKISDIG